MMSLEELEAVATQSGISAILLVGPTLEPPDEILYIGHQFIADCLIRLGWATAMSVFCGVLRSQRVRCV